MEVFDSNPKEGYGCFVSISLLSQDDFEMRSRDDLRILLGPENLLVIILQKEKFKTLLTPMIFFDKVFEVDQKHG